MSDWYIANSSGGAVGKRIQVVILYLVGVAISLLAFRAVPSGLASLQAVIVFMIGFFLYGPQMLIGKRDEYKCDHFLTCSSRTLWR